MSLDALFNAYVTLERSSVAVDQSGGAVKTWAPVQLGIPCSIQPSTGRERMLFAQRQIMYTNKIYLSADIGAKKDDRVKVPATGQVFVVTGYANQAGRDVVWCLEVREQT